MPEIFSPAGPSPVADASPDPAVTTASAPVRDEERTYSLLVGKRLAQFAVNLKANGHWMKQFLHGNK